MPEGVTVEQGRVLSGPLDSGHGSHSPLCHQSEGATAVPIPEDLGQVEKLPPPRLGEGEAERERQVHLLNTHQAERCLLPARPISQLP